MINKQKKGKKMKKIKVKTQEDINSSSGLQMLGFLLVAFAIADFALSYAGVNLTSFMGAASRFTPMIFGGFIYLISRPKTIFILILLIWHDVCY